MLTPIPKSNFDLAWAILKAAFPRDEIRPYDAQKALLDRADYTLFGLFDEKNDLSALAAVYDLGAFRFLEHLAVDTRKRNGGLGSRILSELKRQSDSPIILEVEPPKDELTKRRIAFYQRNAFFPNGAYPYVQPPLAPGQGAVELLIMSSGRTLEEDDFFCVRGALYEQVYRWREER